MEGNSLRLVFLRMLSFTSSCVGLQYHSFFDLYVGVFDLIGRCWNYKKTAGFCFPAVPPCFVSLKAGCR